MSLNEGDLENSLRTLTRLLYKHHNQKVILLIDEYDVPLDKAFLNGYYDDMINFIRIFLGGALKTNDSTEFAIVTGCLRISKESIFTGINNLKVFSITDARCLSAFVLSTAGCRVESSVMKIAIIITNVHFTICPVSFFLSALKV